MATAVDWVFRFIHVISGVMWVGGIFLWSMVIVPRIMKNGPPAIRRPFLEAVLAPITRYLTLAGFLTLASGVVVMGLLSDWAIVDTFQRGAYGAALGIGFVMSVLMLTTAIVVIKPTATALLGEMQKLPPGPPAGPPPESIPRLAKKLGMASMVNLVAGTIALAAMAWAVNVVR